MSHLRRTSRQNPRHLHNPHPRPQRCPAPLHLKRNPTRSSAVCVTEHFRYKMDWPAALNTCAMPNAPSKGKNAPKPTNRHQKDNHFPVANVARQCALKQTPKPTLGHAILGTPHEKHPTPN
ncbi:uncharacterized protein TM35_000201930 [Trypanosoma theileri]|uniref:Tbingi protein n=1 Tax=Trypanosoma theileri TaxID=67003 RepID=A0A1X0NSV6_9TRYP|nr:uncharacterized protein TM35_000201930 [Trypanosoma theileri]ORC87784.1 hypothetical protein TM35_000201930 [Trypanosoma theileri]